MITCQMATKRLVAHWNAPSPRHTEELRTAEDLQSAIDHIHHCPQCEGRLGFMLHAALSEASADAEDALTCTECETLLPEYVQAEQNGQAQEARWQPMALHLAICPHCARAHAELETLLASVYETGEPPLNQIPAPDLAFLHPPRLASRRLEAPRPEPAAARLDELGRLVIELTDQLLRTLLPPARQPAYALSGLKSAAPGTLFELPIQASNADLNVTIQAERERAASDRCTLTVQVDIPSRGGWPHLAGTEVTLRQTGLDPAQEWTDAYGEAVFERVPVENLSGLVIEVLPGA